MHIFRCESCKYIAKNKSNYNKHLKTIKHIRNVRNSSNINNNNILKSCKQNNLFYCHNCSASFLTKASARRHENYYCKQIININMSVRKFKKQFLRDKNPNHIEMLIKNIGGTINYTTNNTTNNTISTISNNVKINKFGNQNISYISHKIMDNMIRSPRKMIQKLIELTHFHKKHPENWNIKINNKKDKFLEIYDGREWIYGIKCDTIKHLVNHNYGLLDIYYDEYGEEKMGIYEKNRYINFQKKYEKNDRKLLNNLKNEVELSILNSSKKMNNYLKQYKNNSYRDDFW